MHSSLCFNQPVLCQELQGAKRIPAQALGTDIPIQLLHDVDYIHSSHLLIQQFPDDR